MKKQIPLFFLAILFLTCKEEKKEIITNNTNNISTEKKEIETEWISLMDSTLWHGFNQDQLPSSWVFKDDIIKCIGKGGGLGDDIVTNLEFDNFELSLSWKISKGGNSGIFYHVVEDKKYKAIYETGAEYQLIDDVGFPEVLEDWQKAGVNYAMHLANSKKNLKPIGEWNTTVIKFDNGKVEHWLNGEKIVSFDKFTEDWKTRRNSGKWTDFPDYGITNKGLFGLQDHGANVWFKNIKARKL